jgi:hypothetical protein
MCECEDGRALALRVGVDRVRPHIRVVFDEIVRDVVALPGAAGREAGEERDVHVRDHVGADPAVPAASPMGLGHKVPGLEIPLGPVGGSMFAKGHLRGIFSSRCRRFWLSLGNDSASVGTSSQNN